MSHTIRLNALAGLLLLANVATGLAQSPGLARYQPLDHREPPGKASSWAALTGGLVPGYLQPVRVETPGGSVTVYSGGRADSAEAPAQVAIAVGNVYRVRLADIPNYPGVELFPTIELISHLHPPRGRKDDFPVRIPIDFDDIDLALDGRMVTKVIYLEQPDLASMLQDGDDVEVFPIPPRENALHEADRRGRPIAIVRLGGRTPDPAADNRPFFGNPPPIEVSNPKRLPPALERAVEPSIPPTTEPPAADPGTDDSNTWNRTTPPTRAAGGSVLDELLKDGWEPPVLRR